jgi:hypothetical protein
MSKAKTKQASPELKTYTYQNAKGELKDYASPFSEGESQAIAFFLKLAEEFGLGDWAEKASERYSSSGMNAAEIHYCASLVWRRWDTKRKCEFNALPIANMFNDVTDAVDALRQSSDGRVGSAELAEIPAVRRHLVLTEAGEPVRPSFRVTEFYVGEEGSSNVIAINYDDGGRVQSDGSVKHVGAPRLWVKRVVPIKDNGKVYDKTVLGTIGLSSKEFEPSYIKGGEGAIAITDEEVKALARFAKSPCMQYVDKLGWPDVSKDTSDEEEENRALFNMLEEAERWASERAVEGF